MSTRDRRTELPLRGPEESLLSAAFLERMLAEFARDPSAVPAGWRAYLADGGGDGSTGAAASGPTFARPEPPAVPSAGAEDEAAAAPPASAEASAAADLQHRVDRLVWQYRVHGHRAARIDPLDRERPSPPELDPARNGITASDLDRPVVGARGRHRRQVREVIDRIRRIYCGPIGVEFMHIGDGRAREWVAAKMESDRDTAPDATTRLRILDRLTEAEAFEVFLRRKYLGATSFSIEGSETLIPLLDLAIDKAGVQGVAEIVIGMAHRGRLNVLANVLGKPPRQIFREFEDREPRRFKGSGDVSYHLGHSSDRVTAAGDRVHLSLCFNPSHLEFIDPVAVGRVRAKQDRSGDSSREHSLALLIHGDASLAGEGVVQETLVLSELPAYRVGGTLHVVVNNQIGFTTPPSETRSSEYATGVARMLDSPIFHVNGGDPEAVLRVVELAMDFRRRFARDVFIDLYGYRRHGHNEADEPSFTQPLLYRKIREQESTRASYARRLVELGVTTAGEVEAMLAQAKARLEAALAETREGPPAALEHAPPSGVWAGYRGGCDAEVEEVPTAVQLEHLQELLLALTRLPDGFHLHPKLERGFGQRRAMAAGERPIDWAAAEALAFASLAATGTAVRLSGQDTERGTFGQRHAVLHDVETGDTWRPLSYVAPGQAPVEIWNSPLSEVGVLGFEYGYSLDRPEALVLWEAQYGDFVNAAQVVIDQFLASAEDKWWRLSGLGLLLPHGYEGRGPEHSSARLERLLQLAAEDNLQIVQPTTPAQYFHVLRRQVARPIRKPLVLLTPKSLLRHRQSVSSLEDLATGRFQAVLPDSHAEETPDVAAPPSRVLLCSGKIYFELVERRQALRRWDTAIARLEQLYPWPQDALRAALAPYPDRTRVVWVQEEPANQGAWPYVERLFCGSMFERFPLTGVSRPASASPATGSYASHQLEQRELLDAAFGGGGVGADCR
ncbi:MAG TPA: 2-oxoglutarate dehydrogenase E1 component [Thermoanaerobaculia bacterium]|nr:2-oxoglutarate dehydrogenase E1 component [Thermoanaerobaculia bacterium]